MLAYMIKQCTVQNFMQKYGLTSSFIKSWVAVNMNVSGKIIHVFWLFWTRSWTFRFYLFQMKPTRCTLLPNKFISASLHVSGSYFPIIRIIYCIYTTLVFFHSVWVAVWSAGSNQQTRQPPIQSVKIPVSHRYSKFSWWWEHSCPKHVEKLK